MLLVYDSRTGNVERFIRRLGLPCVKVGKDLVVDEPFVLVTYTTGFGKVPPSTGEFLARSKRFMRGVSSSGNRNWGLNFGKAADLIANSFGVPVISKFELMGTDGDVRKFLAGVKSIEVG